MAFQVHDSVTSRIKKIPMESGSELAHSFLEPVTEADTSINVVPEVILPASGCGSFYYAAQ